MPEPDHILRGILASAALASVLLSGSFFGAIWPDRGWPIRVICIGLFGVLVYGFVGQIKAYNLDVPFDAVSWFGLIAYTVLLVGFGWFTAREQRTRRGR